MSASPAKKELLSALRVRLSALLDKKADEFAASVSATTEEPAT